MTDSNRHPLAETLAAYAEGNVDAETRATVLAHLPTCAACTRDVLAVTAHLREERRPSRRGWWLAAAAAAAIAVVGAVLLRHREPSIERLVELAPRSERLVEPRLSGGFAWAAYAGTDRTAGAELDAAQMKLIGAAGELVERAERNRDAASQHAAGVAMVLVQKPADGIPRLEAAARIANDAATWNDLAAARYAVALQLGRASLYPEALSAVDRALHLDPKLPEALFNRALILERLGVTEEARRAWQRYLRADSSSPWAVEARARLADLPPSTRASQFERIRPLLEEAAQRGDGEAVLRHVEAHHDRARAHAESEYLGRWGEAVLHGRDAEAARWLAAARGVAGALVRVSGESLARDAVQSIDSARGSVRATIASAHAAYRRGRIAYAHRRLDVALVDLLRAAEAFEAADDPMSLAARYYAAGVRLARTDTSTARADLERLLAEVDARAGYVNLRARVRWELGRARMHDDDWAGAAALLHGSAALFRRSRDRASEAFVEAMRARALTFHGRADEAWIARTRAFAALSAEGESALLAVGVMSAMQVAWLAGHRDAGLGLSRLQVDIARTVADPVLVVEALATRAKLLAAVDGHEALRAARQARTIAQNAEDPAQRARLLADADAAMGAALAASHPRQAMEHLTHAIEFFETHGLPYAMPEPLLLRARCLARIGDAASAMRDLQRGMRIVQRRSSGAEVAGVLGAAQALFTDAIGLSLDRGDVAAAFAIAERSRFAEVALGELQQRLSGSGVVVLEMVALPEELVTFAISEDQIVVSRRRRSAPALEELAEKTRKERGTASVSALYEDAIRPVEEIVAGARAVVIVPDPRLAGVPFAALYDARTRRHLVERVAVSIARSAASLRRDAEAREPFFVAAVELPSAARPLAEAEREIGEVASEYRRARTIVSGRATLSELREAARRADVLHLTGHTETQPGGGEHALILGGERISSKTIQQEFRLRGGIVVLAACETIRPPASPATHARSLADAFAVAGAADVVGTLAPIGDRDARLLFRALHRRLAAGMNPADALCAVQREAIARGGDRSDSWRALALLTTRIPVANSPRKVVAWARP